MDRSTHDLFARRLVAFAENDAPAAGEGDDDTLVIPEDLTALSDDDLAALREQAVSAFDDLFGDGTGLTQEQYDDLARLTDGIEAITAEVTGRETATAERADAAAALAARIHPEDSEGTEGAEGDEGAETDEDPEGIDATGTEPVAGAAGTAAAPQAIAASGAREVRVNLSAVQSQRGRRPAPRRTGNARRGMTAVTTDAEGNGLDWLGIGQSIDRSLQSYQVNAFRTAAAQGRHMRQQKNVATFAREFPEDLMVRSSDQSHVDAVIQHAVDESRLPGGSLVASGGWCAPSETLYNLIELESRDGLLSVPEIGVARGGIRFTPGPTFEDIYSSDGFFLFTEAQDIAGTYGVDANGVGDGSAGTKPCFKVECPDFQEERLNLDGLCLTAGILQSRGYPEVIARTTRGALVAHDHKMSANQIAKMVTGSTAVAYPADTVGAVAPLLDSIEQQVEHYRYIHRMSRSTTLEAIFPYWVRGAIRSDLARRLGVDLLDVSDARIAGWFTMRGIAPQYVYDWQPLTGAAGAFVAWPTTVKFLLYAAGTWVKGASDVITLDTLYDSTLLGTNDYTALFTEEGWFMAKRGHDSRAVTVSLCPDGSTHAGVLIDCDGTATPAV